MVLEAWGLHPVRCFTLARRRKSRHGLLAREARLARTLRCMCTRMRRMALRMMIMMATTLIRSMAIIWRRATTERVMVLVREIGLLDGVVRVRYAMERGACGDDMMSSSDEKRRDGARSGE